MAVSRVFSEIFNIEKWPWNRGQR